ncbi:MAG: pseudouridine-5'-phosphate glycosidase [Actinomycetia bacterium]|nr:pseudouridine-5'-phosphate glycosidase [Actinomycetes bacterium]MCP5035133.1 pseudouridine-5'-phosphate glycosidase [Actinomycetes bacterium]
MVRSPRVGHAIDNSQPVVALETTIFSELGLPSPHNIEALARCEAAVVDGGAEPALTAVLDGVPRVGVEDDAKPRLCGPARKVAARDLSVALAQSWAYGATTVSASLTLAANAGVRVFATGGIGGVHQGAEQSGDISADLDALARHQVVTVSAGAKVFLDLARTLEYLETASVPVLGWRCGEFPAFHAPSSGLPLGHTVQTAIEVAEVARAHWQLGGGGLLVAAPVPAADGLDLEELLVSSAEAERRVVADGITGPEVTPAVLAHLVELTDGRVLSANLSLAEHNATVAADIAVALAST